MKRRGLLAAWLTFVWVVLWGDVSVANVLGGAVVAVGLLLAYPVAREPARRGVRWLPLARFLVHFAWKVLQANAIVAWEVVTPRNRLNQGIVAVPVAGGDDVLLTSLSNAISLTPGTLTLEVRREPPTLYVHVMHLRSVEAVRHDVRTLEQYLSAAFPRSPAAGANAVAGGSDDHGPAAGDGAAWSS